MKQMRGLRLPAVQKQRLHRQRREKLLRGGLRRRVVKAVTRFEVVAARLRGVPQAKGLGSKPDLSSRKKMTLITEAMKMTGPNILSRIHLRRPDQLQGHRHRVLVGRTKFRLGDWLVLVS
ncbi:MAG: hypothetical protein U0936_19445 [Planctomycetaceae bacterium]